MVSYPLHLWQAESGTAPIAGTGSKHMGLASNRHTFHRLHLTRTLGFTLSCVIYRTFCTKPLHPHTVSLQRWNSGSTLNWPGRDPWALPWLVC